MSGSRFQPQADSGVNVVGRSVDDTSLRAAQEHLLAADDEVDASVSGNDAVPPPIERQSVRCSVRTVSEYTFLSWSP